MSEARNWKIDGPCVIDGAGADICLAVSEVHAKLIVRAVSCHDELIDSLKLARLFIVKEHNEEAVGRYETLGIIEAALAKARG